LVGIDEACSGVRSLQAALMVSIFLGELWRLSFLRRLNLIAGSLLLVLLANFGRTTVLVWAGAHHGIEAVGNWHNVVCTSAFVVAFGVLLVLAWLLRSKANAELLRMPASPQPHRVPRWVWLSCLAWLVVVEGATEVWYSSNESGIGKNPRWAVR